MDGTESLGRCVHQGGHMIKLVPCYVSYSTSLFASSSNPFHCFLPRPHSPLHLTFSPTYSLSLIFLFVCYCFSSPKLRRYLLFGIDVHHCRRTRRTAIRRVLYRGDFDFSHPPPLSLLKTLRPLPTFCCPCWKTVTDDFLPLFYFSSSSIYPPWTDRLWQWSSAPP